MTNITVSYHNDKNTHYQLNHWTNFYFFDNSLANFSVTL